VDLLLYRLNFSGLTVSSVLIALFFAVLWRSNRRAELRWWTCGWMANAAAMLIASAFSYLQPPAIAFALVFAAYLGAKSVYVWLLARGAFEFLGRRPSFIEARHVVPAIATLCVIALILITTRDRAGLIAQAIIVESGFAALYVVAQWLLAMGMVIAIAARAQRELDAANAQIIEAQAGVRRLADRDPLTGLANRRALPDVLRAVQPHGAQLIFFDLNDFKKINDEHGHQAGDECLARFAQALTQCFRPTDAVMRYGGDEFIVVAAGLTETAAYERADSVRARVGSPGGGLLPIRFAVGIGRLEAGGNPDDALREADEAMYRTKRRRSAARPRAEAAPQLPLH
jgi:diguanylate cyclase (GGDEF)-like protein